MSNDHDTKRRRLLDATDDGPVIPAGGPDRRGLLKGAVATAAAVVGFPLAGSMGARATGDEELVEYYARPERVDESVERNEELLDALDGVGLVEGATGGGLQVSVVTVDGETLPEHRLFVDADFGTLSIVVSPVDGPLGGHVHVVTDEERMDAAPFEWPLDESTELPDGRYLFRVERDGWAEAGFEGVDYRELVTDVCGTVPECKGPSSSDDCYFVNCCDMVERTGPCPIDEDSSNSTSDGFLSCEPGPCETFCWEVSGCHCIERDGLLCP